MTTLSAAQLSFFADNGYLIISDLFNTEEKARIVSWTNQVKSWPEDGDLGYLPYQEVDNKGSWILCRTEVQHIPCETVTCSWLYVELCQLP